MILFLQIAATVAFGMIEAVATGVFESLRTYWRARRPPA